MAEGRTEHDWAQTSAVLALIANVHRDPRKTRVFKPADFNPTAKPEHEYRGKADIQMLKHIFVKPKRRPCDTPSDNSPSTGSPGSSADSSS